MKILDRKVILSIIDKGDSNSQPFTGKRNIYYVELSFSSFGRNENEPEKLKPRVGLSNELAVHKQFFRFSN